MPFTFRQHLTTWFGLLGLLIVGSCLVIFVWQLPQLRALRQKIDANRASLLILQDQQSNLQALKSETDNILRLKTSLDKDIWTFSEEDNFYNRLEVLATTIGLKLDEPNITNATPGSQPLLRAVTITMHGPLDKVYTMLDEIQKISPLIAITETQLSGGPDYSLTVSGQTVWQ
jgi:Tfp pilus assembly protein PilO